MIWSRADFGVKSRSYTRRSPRTEKNKNYKLRFQGKLAEKKVTVKKILGIGISYDRKTKKHRLSQDDNQVCS